VGNKEIENAYQPRADNEYFHGMKSFSKLFSPGSKDYIVDCIKCKLTRYLKAEIIRRKQILTEVGNLTGNCGVEKCGGFLSFHTFQSIVNDP